MEIETDIDIDIGIGIGMNATGAVRREACLFFIGSKGVPETLAECG